MKTRTLNRVQQHIIFIFNPLRGCGFRVIQNPQLYRSLKYSFPISFSFRRKSPKGDRGMKRAGGEV